jgi:hypothetical protein
MRAKLLSALNCNVNSSKRTRSAQASAEAASAIVRERPTSAKFRSSPTSTCEAERYEGRIKEGGILMSVHCDCSERTKRAKDIERTCAEDVASAGEASADTKTDKPLPRAV